MSLEDLFYFVAGFLIGAIVLLLIELFIIWGLEIEYYLTAKCYLQNSKYINQTELAGLFSN